MGGCVVSCMSAINHAKTVENRHILAIQAISEKSTPIQPKADEPTNGTESRIYRSPSRADMTMGQLYDMFYGGSWVTMPVSIKRTAEKYATRNAMAYRPWDHIEKTEIEEDGKKKPWELIHLKETQYITYKDMWERIVAFGHGLAKLGLEKNSFVGIYEETRWEWLITLYGAWSQGLTGVTVYSNLGEDALRYAIKESELPAMILNAKNVKGLIKNCKAAGVRIPKLIYLDTLPADLDTEGAELISWTSVLESGRGMPEPELPSDPNALALIMYTSGTTGDPKGVMITHGNCVAAVMNLQIRIEPAIGKEGADETYVCFLPLAHILEFAAENLILLRGSKLCFGHPRTLTDLSARPCGDFSNYKPIYVVGVPRVFETIKKGVMARLPPAGSIKRRIFDRAFEDRKAALRNGYETPFWNDKVFMPLNAMLGGRCLAFVSGGAPLTAETEEFLAVAFGMAITQGYGLTETCAICVIRRYYDLNYGSCGGNFPSVEVKLRDVEQWKHTNNPPQGEICVRGPTVAKGYYKQPDKTAEVFTPDGWFYTGDICQREPDGSFLVVGRTKALAKNSVGEYIAMEALEAMYVLNELTVPNGVCVLVNPLKAYITALVLTDEKKAMKFAGENKIEGTWPEILVKPEFHQKAAVSLAETAKRSKRLPFEIVKRVCVLRDEWTPDNGILTAAMKIKRRVVDERYAQLISELFCD